MSENKFKLLLGYLSKLQLAYSISQRAVIFIVIPSETTEYLDAVFSSSFIIRLIGGPGAVESDSPSDSSHPLPLSILIIQVTSYPPCGPPFRYLSLISSTVIAPF